MKTFWKIFLLSFTMLFCIHLSLSAAKTFVGFHPDGFVWIQNGKACPILTDEKEDKGVLRAINNLKKDATEVTGATPTIIQNPKGKKMLVIGTIEQSRWIKALVASGKIEAEELENQREKYIIQTIAQPFEGVDEAIVIAGSDKRGAIYGVYELSRQMGVSPWYYWPHEITFQTEYQFEYFFVEFTVEPSESI